MSWKGSEAGEWLSKRPWRYSCSQTPGGSHRADWSWGTTSTGASALSASSSKMRRMRDHETSPSCATRERAASKPPALCTTSKAASECGGGSSRRSASAASASPLRHARRASASVSATEGPAGRAAPLEPESNTTAAALSAAVAAQRTDGSRHRTGGHWRSRMSASSGASFISMERAISYGVSAGSALPVSPVAAASGGRTGSSGARSRTQPARPKAPIHLIHLALSAPNCAASTRATFAKDARWPPASPSLALSACVGSVEGWPSSPTSSSRGDTCSARVASA
mmetsp:Transcript_9781/g.29874  ORF Transcript_9781/g.29874 Transcript_9781/m.29874 type:complete len:284 (-) Transcript_9781:1537-2388(-)